MPDILARHVPQIRELNASPSIEEVEDTFKKGYHSRVSHQEFLKADTQMTFEEDLELQRRRMPNFLIPVSASLAPQLPLPDVVKAEVKKVDTISKPKLIDVSESELLKLQFDSMHALKISKYEKAENLTKDAIKKQNFRKTLHSENNEVLRKLEERAKTSSILGWGQVGTTMVLMAVSIASFALALITGGISVIVGAIAAVASAANSAVSISSSIMQMDAYKKQGESQAIQAQDYIEDKKIRSILAENLTVMQQIHDLWQRFIQELRNQASVIKIFQ